MPPDVFDKVSKAVWETSEFLTKLNSTELFEFCAGILGAAAMRAIMNKEHKDAITSLETLHQKFIPGLLKDVQASMERKIQ